MNELQLRWLEQAEEESAPVDVAEQFTLWTVADEASLVGLVASIGWQQWEELQDYLVSHPECRCKYSAS